MNNIHYSVLLELSCPMLSVYGYVVCYSVLVDYPVDLLNIAILRSCSQARDRRKIQIQIKTHKINTKGTIVIFFIEDSLISDI